MKTMLICLIIGIIISIFIIINTQQQDAPSKNYLEHLPENVKVYQASSIISNEDEFTILGL